METTCENANFTGANGGNGERRAGEVELEDGGLRQHRMMREQPWSEESAKFVALCGSIERDGIFHPVLMTEKREIVDFEGVNVWRAAKALGLKRLPVVFVQEEDVPAAILSGLLHRQHLTRSARAYLAYSLLEAAHGMAKKRQVACLKKGAKSPDFPVVDRIDYGAARSVEEFALENGFSRDLFFQAKAVHEIFARDAEYKELMEPRILADPIGGEHEEHRPVGLGAVIAGWEGRKLKDKERPNHAQLDLFAEGVSIFTRRFGYWEGFGADERVKARAIMERAVAELPEAGLEEMERVVRQEARRRKETA